MKAILLLGTSLVSAQYLSEAVEALGVRPIFLLKIDEYSGDPKRAILQCEHYEADVNSIEDIFRVIQTNKFMDDVIAVTSLLDETLQNACIIAKKFNIAGPDSVLSELTDKAKVQKIIPEFNPPSLVFTLSDISEERLKNFLSDHANANEFMLKPAISSGAVGISILNAATTTDQLKKLIFNSQIENAGTQSWIIQPRIIGQLYSLEGYVKNNQIYFLGFSSRIRKELTESANQFPVDKELSEHSRQQCYNAVTALVQRSKYTNGYFHCEFIINANTVYFIDGNMGRIAGGSIVQQIALTYGKNPIDIIKHVIDLGPFKGVNTANFSYENCSEKPTLSIFYSLAEPATVLNITSPADMMSFHTRIVDNGKKMPSIGNSDSAWVGFIAGFKEKVLSEIEHILINTNKGPMRPFYMLTE